jgi:hypothetical protein
MPSSKAYVLDLLRRAARAVPLGCAGVDLFPAVKHISLIRQLKTSRSRGVAVIVPKVTAGVGWLRLMHVAC